MDSKIFGNLNTYFDIYVVLSRCPLTRNSFVKKMTETGKSNSRVSEYAKKAINGDFAFISGTEDSIALDQEALISFLTQICAELNLDADIRMKKKKKEESEFEPVNRLGEAKIFKEMNNQINAASATIRVRDATIREMEETIAKKDKEITDLKMQILSQREEMQKKVSAAITEEMDKKVLIPNSITSEPAEVFAMDFFYDNPGRELDAEHLVSKSGGVLDSIYRFEEEMPPEITEESYWQRICARFRSGGLFKKRIEDQTKLESSVQKTKTSLDANRIKSINMLLADDEMDNQTKLSTYAFWYFNDDPQMEELLVFAGEHGINANYVIQLLEKPAQYRNYRTMRAFLMQVQMASEAHIKRAAAKELLCGEWSVVANYCGKPCHFKMMPVEELENFARLLQENKIPRALTILKKALKTTSGPMDQKLDEQKKERDVNIPAPSFLHAMDGDTDLHAPVDDSCYEDFEENEVGEEGEKNE